MKKLMIAGLLLLISILIFLIFPSKRTGPLGIGLPSPMENYVSKKGQFEIEHPISWIVSETPNGSHGDLDIIAEITVPGRSFPHVTISMHSFRAGDISNVVDWGISRAENKDSYKLMSLEAFNSEKYDGFLHVYNWASETILGSDEIDCKDWYIIKGEIGYSLSFCSQPQQKGLVEEVFQVMIKSFYAW
jgi:hypothetical protein